MSELLGPVNESVAAAGAAERDGQRLVLAGPGEVGVHGGGDIGGPSWGW
ncbi:hypothetical protein ACFU5N_26745 [Streptomyces albidoflavus]